MRVYGFDSSDIMRGEIQGHQADAQVMNFSPEEVQASLDWEYLSSSFNKAKTALIQAMQEEGVDTELIAAAQSIKRNCILF